MTEKLYIPNITNPGLSFTENTYDMLKRIHECFSCYKGNSIPYKDFQEQFIEHDATGGSKVRMVFPIMRKAGCIYPASNTGDVVFVDGDFLTDLGRQFLGASQLYYETLAKLNTPQWKMSPEMKTICDKVRAVYAGISKQIYANLSENDDVYPHLMWFVEKYKSVTKHDAEIFLATLEQTSSKSGSVKHCQRDETKIDRLINLYRQRKLILDYEGQNNAAGYYLAILKSLLLLDSYRGMFRITSFGKEVL